MACLSSSTVPSLTCVTLHGGSTGDAREKKLAALRRGDASVMVCTDLAARGLDLPSVKSVIHFDFPEDAASFIHRTGRTGRFGAAGQCFALVEPKSAEMVSAIRIALAMGKPLDGVFSRRRGLRRRLQTSTDKLQQEQATWQALLAEAGEDDSTGAGSKRTSTGSSGSSGKAGSKSRTRQPYRTADGKLRQRGRNGMELGQL